MQEDESNFSNVYADDARALAYAALTHEWASFTTRDFPENRDAKSGDQVRIVMQTEIAPWLIYVLRDGQVMTR